MNFSNEQARYPLASIPDMLDSGKYQFKKTKIWNPIEKSRYIESLLLNIPLHPITLIELNYAQHKVIDGNTRLLTIYDYLTNAFSLDSLEFFTHLDGKYFKELDESLQRSITRRYLSANIILFETQNEISIDVIERIIKIRLNAQLC